MSVGMFKNAHFLEYFSKKSEFQKNGISHSGQSQNTYCVQISASELLHSSQKYREGEEEENTH